MTDIPPIPESSPATGQTQAVTTSAPGKGMAITAMILGIVSIVFCMGPLAGIPALILGIIVLSCKKPGKGMAVGGIVTGALGCSVIFIALLVSILLPSLNRARELAKRSVCGSNLKNLGTASVMYYTGNNDVYPPTLQHLIDAAGHSEYLLQCPSEKTDRVDYFYMQASYRDPGNTIIACDYMDNHRGERRNVLFLDSHVERYDEVSFQRLLTESQNLKFAEKLRAAEYELKAADRAMQYQKQYEKQYE